MYLDHNKRPQDQKVLKVSLQVNVLLEINRASAVLTINLELTTPLQRLFYHIFDKYSIKIACSLIIVLFDKDIVDCYNNIRLNLRRKTKFNNGRR